MRNSILLAALALSPVVTVFAPPPAAAQSGASLSQQVDTILAAAPAGSRIGMVVETLDGRPIYTRAADERFIPASNTKIFTTAAAYARMDALQKAAKGAAVFLDRERNGQMVVTLVGYGDPALSSAEGCTDHCLATLADAVAAKTRVVHDIVGDDSFFADERWSSGMSWNNMPYSWGTGISALSLDNNQFSVEVTPPVTGCPPQPKPPAPPQACRPEVRAGAYYPVENRAIIRANSNLEYGRTPGDRQIVVSGGVASDAEPRTLRMGIDDPAHYAAFRLREFLIARGVTVHGQVRAQHRPVWEKAGSSGPSGQPEHSGRAGQRALMAPRFPIASVTPASLRDDIRTINKQSQNLHAELLLRRLGTIKGSGTVEEGLVELGSIISPAGLDEHDYALSDGSGMSTYNRVTPRGMSRLLRWIDRQSWGQAWRDTLPVGGVDGTLRNRFTGTSLAGKITAKTGSINASRALSGYFTTASGQTLVFSSFANDVPDEKAREAVAAIDAALVAIAATN